MPTPKISALLTIAAALTGGPAFAIDPISVEFSGDVSAQEQQVFKDAAAFWNSLITGYKANFDGVGAPANHSLLITASTPELDGIGGTLGQAGPTTIEYADNNPLGTPTYARMYARTGTMEFDSFDTAALLDSGTFYGVVLHEMGHVIGLGTLWETNTRADPGFGTLYDPEGETNIVNGEPAGKYTGEFAVAAWRTEFDKPEASFVPVEKGGGEGTFDGHWNEFDGGILSVGPVSAITGTNFSNELMTGWASEDFFLSTVTIGALEDLGYEVDYSKAGPIAAVPEVSHFAFTTGCALLLLVKRRRNSLKS